MVICTVDTLHLDRNKRLCLDPRLDRGIHTGAEYRDGQREAHILGLEEPALVPPSKHRHDRDELVSHERRHLPAPAVALYRAAAPQLDADVPRERLLGRDLGGLAVWLKRWKTRGLSSLGLRCLVSVDRGDASSK